MESRQPSDLPSAHHAMSPSAPIPKRRQRVGADQQQHGQAGNWPVRSALQRQRIGQWFTWTRKSRLHMSLRALRDAAARDGVELSVSAIRRLEGMADLRVAAERQWVALDNILWLAAFSGQTLADLDRFLQSGEWRYVGNLSDAAPSVESLADRVRVRFLSLSPERQLTVASFIEHERYLDELDIQAALGMVSPAAFQPPQLPQLPLHMGQPSESAANSGVGDVSETTRRALDELDQASGMMREAQYRDQADQASQPGVSDTDEHPKRRRQQR